MTPASSRVMRAHCCHAQATEPGYRGPVPGFMHRPAADWRDQVLTHASQPWQPGPGQARDPAAPVLPERHAPEAGIEPDT
jgi:hypothetical protein